MPFIVFPIAGTVLGLIMGSFLATLIIRWPEGRSVMTGRSHCDGCDRTLKAYELIPVVSYALARGRCMACGAKISPHHLAIELVAALIGFLALYLFPGIEGFFGAIFGWLLLTLAALDAEHQWLPDRLTGLLAASGLLATLFIVSPNIVERLIGGFAGYAALIIIALVFRVIRNREGLGGGDPKMLGAIGCWLGWQSLPLVLLGASLIGLIAIFSLKMRGQTVTAKTKLPLGSLMAVSAFPIWLLQSSGVNLLG